MSNITAASFASTHHVESGENVAVVVTGLEIFGDVGKRRQVLGILSRTRDVSDLVFRDDVLQGRREETIREGWRPGSQIKRRRRRFCSLFFRRRASQREKKTNLIYYAPHHTHTHTHTQ